MQGSDFRGSYATARDLFRATARKCGWELATYVHPLHACLDGWPLSVDVASCGSPDAKAALLTVSGTHGVEGIVGSAAQVAQMRSADARSLQGLRIVHVHGINPFGFDRRSRTNENNVDLNRNFIDWDSGATPGNPDYEQVHRRLIAYLERPQAEPGEFVRECSEAMGQSRFFDAITRGQYTHADGVMYGGSSRQWSHDVLDLILETRLGTVDRLACIDWHSGLGEYGKPCFLCFSESGSAARERACAWWGRERIEWNTAFGDAEVPRYQGLLIRHVESTAAAREFTGAVVEFGTRPYTDMLEALAADLRARLRADADAHAPSLLQEAFAPSDPQWRADVIETSLAIHRQALSGLRGAA